MSSEGKKDEWLFNHALYHLLAHWAVYIAVLMMLITLGFLLATSPITASHRVWPASLALIALWAAEIYLVVRIIRLGNFVNEQLNGAASQWELVPHPWNHTITIMAATLISLWDFMLLHGWI